MFEWWGAQAELDGPRKRTYERKGEREGEGERRERETLSLLLKRIMKGRRRTPFLSSPSNDSFRSDLHR